MADERKVFPVEKVLELVTGKNNADTKEIASYILGISITSAACASAAAPFAAAWLARWYPRFMALEWKEDQSWDSFVKQASASIGDHISLTPMSGRLKTLAGQALDVLTDSAASVARQTDATIRLEKRVSELEPLEARLQAAQKKCDELEEKIKSLKADMAAAQRRNAEFQGKLAIDHDELMRNIKEAIKDGMKGLSVGSVVAGTVEAAAGAETPQPENVVPDDFGFGSSGTDSDGFGF